MKKGPVKTIVSVFPLLFVGIVLLIGCDNPYFPRRLGETPDDGGETGDDIGEFDALLSSLTLNGDSAIGENGFDKDRFAYPVRFEDTVIKVRVKGIAGEADRGAVVSYERIDGAGVTFPYTGDPEDGHEILLDKTNHFTRVDITVTAPDETANTYTLYITTASFSRIVYMNKTKRITRAVSPWPFPYTGGGGGTVGGGGAGSSGPDTGSDVFIYPRSVDIRPFEISEFEITYALWEAVRAEVPGYTLPQGNGGTAPANPFTPVTHVSWYDAVVWCNAYSEKEGYEPVYLKNGTPVKNPSDRASLDSMVPEWAKNGFRLPTEAEWELAARGGRFPQSLADAKLPPWGDRYAGSGKLAEVGWYLGNTRGSAQEVGLLLPVEIMNPNGQSDYLYDMSGNVLEWCWDWMGPIAWNTPATGPAAAHTDNPQNPNDDHWPGSRVIRGGRWNGPESEGAVRFRYFTGSEIKSNALGFRVARTL